MGLSMDADPVDLVVLKLLANKTAQRILLALADGPSHPRALAAALGASEGDVQRKLHRLEDVGLVRGAWRHEDKTVKEYALVARGLDVRVDEGVQIRLR